MSQPIPPFTRLMARGARKRCPRCGEGPLFKRFNIMHERCSVCGLKYLEEEGALFGTLFLVDRALFVFPLIVMIYFRSYVPNPVWFYVACAMMLFAVIYTLPQRSGMAVALHYLLRRRRSRNLPGGGS